GGFPVLPGAGPLSSADEAVPAGADLGFPLMVKAVMGGGGIGMGVARDEAELAKAAETASTRGARFFADPAIYLERYVEHGRHIEVQVLFDADGNGVHLYERECSVQRRHQKVIEESPSRAVGEALLSRLAEAAVGAMRAFGYDEGEVVPMCYDPLIGNRVSFGADRECAFEGMLGALDDIVLEGPRSNVATHRRVLGDDRFVSGAYDTGLLGT